MRALCLVLWAAQGGHVRVVGGRTGAPRVQLGELASLTALPTGLSFSTAQKEVILQPQALASDLVTPHLFVDEVMSGGQKAWQLWEHETFDAEDSNAWSIATRTNCGANPDVFLGGYCKLSSGKVSRSYQLPPHKRVRITARVHFFDEWQGEQLFLDAGGSIRWTRTHNWCTKLFAWSCKDTGIDACGREIPDTLSVPVVVEFAHSAPTLDVVFGSTLEDGTDPCQVSWGLDDIHVNIV